MGIFNLIPRIFGFTSKIDSAESLGLAGVHDSLSYRVHEIERHFHGKERWLGKLAVQTETDWADSNVNNPFVLISGDNTWGSAIQVIGTADTPVIAGSVYFDPHAFLVTYDDQTSPWKIRFIWDDTSSADGITDGNFSEDMWQSDTVVASRNANRTPHMMRRIRCGIDKLWAQGWNVTNNAEARFFIGLHEYEG